MSNYLVVFTIKIRKNLNYSCIKVAVLLIFMDAVSFSLNEHYPSNFVQSHHNVGGTVLCC